MSKTISASRQRNVVNLVLKILGGEKRTSPLVLACVSLMMDSLLNEMLVLRVVRVNDLDCLPSALAFGRIVTLNGEAGQQRCQCTTLGIHTRLYQLLATA